MAVTAVGVTPRIASTEMDQAQPAKPNCLRATGQFLAKHKIKIMLLISIAMIVLGSLVLSRAIFPALSTHLAQLIGGSLVLLPIVVGVLSACLNRKKIITSIMRKILEENPVTL